MALQTLAPDSTTEIILQAMAHDGAAIIADVLPRAERDEVAAELTPYIERTPMGNDDFTGRHTQRTGALVARSPACRGVVMNQKILACARAFLAPFTERIILHLTQTIHIHPTQGAQTLHRDRLAW
ncbi:MAG: hypothetical protein ACI8XZ_004004, partial [Gammaproteobacteria bacterium]